jgi:REP element-mobilizing transposase RayT
MRVWNPDHVYFVTNRCEQERLFLLPRPEVKKLVGAWLAKSLAEHGDGIELYAFVFLSNHFHLLLRDTKGQLPEFMWYFQVNLAKSLNGLLDRHGHFFSREYDAAPVLTDEDFDALYAYVVTNAVKAGLLARARGGPFFSSLEPALEERALEFWWVDRTRKHQLSRRGRKVPESEVTRRYVLALSIPARWRGWTRARRRKWIEGLVAANEARYGKQRRAEGKGFLGVRRILAQSPFMRPRESSFRPRVRVFCRDEDLRKAFLEAVGTLAGLYREAFDGFRKAVIRGRRALLEWPPWTYAPSTWAPVPAR